MFIPVFPTKDVMNHTPQQLESFIERIGTFLASGRQLIRSFYRDYGTDKQQDGFNENMYYDQQAAPLDQWLNDVVSFIAEQFGNSHHYVYFFLEPPQRPSMTRVGWPDSASGTYFAFRAHLQSLSDIAFRLEEKLDVTIRQEIARHERDKSVLYEMTYVGREVRINDVLLCKPDFMSENDNFFAYVFERPWQTIKVTDMLADLQLTEFKKSVAQMLADLKIVNKVRQIFMPNASKTAVEFRNPITRGFADENNLPVLDFGRNDQKS